MAQGGVAMTANKSEFLTPKDVYIAEENLQELHEGMHIEDMYEINTSKHEMFIDDSLEGDSWIDNQLEKALGAHHADVQPSLVALYQSGVNPAEFVESNEARAIKFEMAK